MEPTRELKQAIIDYKNGKADAFVRLYEESQRYVYVCICKIMGDCDNLPEVVSDLMQDTYAEISRHISQLEKVDSFLNWAGSIATRQCYAYLKKNRQYVLFSRDNALEKLAAEEELIPETIMQDREKQRLLRKIIDTELTPMQRICVIAYYYNGQKQSEIARDLGIPENTVKTHLSRAKGKIKEGVLRLENKEGTRLYSVAPFLLLLLDEEIQECVVPAEISKLILSAGNTGAMSAVSAGTRAATAADKVGSSAAGKEGLVAVGEGGASAAGKGVAAALKIKIAAAVIGAGALLAVGCSIIPSQKDQSRVPNRGQERESDSRADLSSGEKKDDSFLDSSNHTETSDYAPSDDGDLETNEKVEKSPYESFEIFPVENLYAPDKENYKIIKEFQGSISAIEQGLGIPVFLVKNKVYREEFGNIVEILELNEEPDDIFYFNSLELGESLFSYFDGKITRYSRVEISFENIEFNEETDFIPEMGGSSYFFLISKQSDNTYLNQYYEASKGKDMALYSEQIVEEFRTSKSVAIDVKAILALRNRYHGYSVYCLTANNELYEVGNVSRRVFEMNTSKPMLTDVKTVYAPAGLAMELTSPVYSKIGGSDTVVYSTVMGEKITTRDDEVEVSFILPDGHNAEEIETIFDVKDKLVYVFHNGDTYITDEISSTDEKAYELRKLENISNLMKDGKVVEITGTTTSILVGENIYILMNDGVLYYYEVR